MVYEMDGRIRYSEVDADGTLTWLSLLEYFQDCSVFQSEYMQMGIEYLATHHMAWVLSSWQVKKNRMPELAEGVRIQTWAYGFQGIYGYRNFSMNDEAGNRLAYANSVWVLVDTITGRPIRVPQEMGEAYGSNPQIPMECSERKIPVPKEYEAKEPVRVPQYFIDTNHHMNNEKYVMIAQEFVPDDFQMGEIRVEYKKAAMLDDVICPRVTTEENQITVVLAAQNEKPYAVVKFLREE